MRNKIVLLMLALFIATSLSATTITKTYTFSTDDLSWEERIVGDSTYDLPRLGGCNSRTGVVGAPDMPIKNVTFVIPWDHRVKEIKISSLSSTDISGARNIAPVQPPFDGETHESVYPNPYYCNSYYPGELVSLDEQDWMMGYNCATVCLYPLAYDPHDSTTILQTSITIQVVTEYDGPPDVYPSQMDEITGIYDIENTVKMYVENPDDVSGYRPSGLTYTEEKIQYLIICPDDIPGVADEFQRLADWYTKTGLKTEVVYISDILGQTSGLSTPEKIRRYLQEKYEGDSDYNLSYVLLVGDDDKLPALKYWCGGAYGSKFGDLYYSDLEGDDWDDDNDGIYGEFITTADVQLSFLPPPYENRGLAYAVECFWTEDGGRTWTQRSHVEDTLEAVDLDFPYQGCGWVLVKGTRPITDEYWPENRMIYGLYRTLDRGMSWLPVEEDLIENWFPPGSGYGGVYLLDATTDGYVFLTAGGNRLWRRTPLGGWTYHVVGKYFQDFDFLNLNDGWAVCQDGVYKTTDGGSNWSKMTLPTQVNGEYWQGLCVISVTELWVAGTSETILYTDDGGITWDILHGPTSGGDLKDIDCCGTYIWAVGYNGLIINSVDGGVNWDYYGETDYDELWIEVAACPSNRGVAAINSNVEVPPYFYHNPGASTGPNPNNFKKFGELLGGPDESSLDDEPNIALGRASVDSREHARIFVDKVLAYQQNPPPGFGDEMLLLITDWSGYNKDGEVYGGQDTDLKLAEQLSTQTDDYAWAENTELEGYNYRRVYYDSRSGTHSTDYNAIADRVIENPEVAVDELNKGFNITLNASHGDEDWLYMPLNPSYGEAFMRRHARSLNNFSGIFLTRACSSNRFFEDSHVPTIECIGEEMLRNPAGGASAYIGSVYPTTISGGSDNPQKPNDFLYNIFAIEPQEGMFRRIGNAFLTIQDIHYHMLGDPAMPVWTDEPEVLTVNHSLQIIPWSNVITVTVTSNGSPVEDARVCLYKPDLAGSEVYEVGLTGSNGQATWSDIDPVNEGPMFVTVSKQNYKPYEGICWVGDTIHSLSPREGYKYDQRSLGFYNSHNVSVDEEGHIHMAATIDDDNNLPYPYYLFSSDDGATWGRYLVESMRSGYAALGMGRANHPYVAYTNVSTKELYVEDVWSGKKRKLLDRGILSMNYQPAFVVDPSSNEACIAVHDGRDRIYFISFDLDYIEDDLKWFSDHVGIVTGVGNGLYPSGTVTKNGKFLFTYDMPHTENKDIYICSPTVPATSLVPTKIASGGICPSISSEGEVLMVTYQDDINFYALYGTVSGEAPGNIVAWKEPELYFTHGQEPQSVGINISLWNKGGAPHKVKTSGRNNLGWSSDELSPNGKPILGAYNPQGAVNYPISRIATAWIEEYSVPGYGIKDSIALKICSLDDYPGSSGFWDVVNLMCPATGGSYPLYTPLDVQWTVGTAGAGNRTVLTFGETGSDSEETHIIDTVYTDHVSSYTYTWGAGDYIDPLDPGNENNKLDPADYPNCYFKAKLIDGNGVEIGNDIEGAFSLLYEAWPPNGDNLKSPPRPPGEIAQIPWSLQSVSSRGFQSVSLFCSMNNGQTWSSTGASCSTPDSTLIDSFTTSSDTIYTYEYSDTLEWEIPEEYTSACLMRLVFEDTTSWKDTLTSDSAFPIIPPGGNENCTRYNQKMVEVGTEQGDIGLVYQAEISGLPYIYYTESAKGWALDTPENLGMGREPIQSQGCLFWPNSVHDTIFYTGWNEDSSAFPDPIAIEGIKTGAIDTRYSTSDIKMLGDTVHMVTVSKIIRLIYPSPPQYVTDYAIEHIGFLKDLPTSSYKDSLAIAQVPMYDSTSESNVSMDIADNTLFLAVYHRDSCYYLRTPLAAASINDIRTIGPGYWPQVSVNEGNVTYSYISSDYCKLIRMWGYLHDTIWVECDTIDLGYDASCHASTEGLLYGIQKAGAPQSYQYIYDPLSEHLSLEETYNGYYSHPFLDTDSSFNRVTSYTLMYDEDSYCLMTDRTFLNGILPSLYIESDDRRSPYTLYRDTCIHYPSVDVDSGLDSLVYNFPYLNGSENYSLLVEFYNECDSATTLLIQVGTEFDTLQIPGNDFSLFEKEIASGTSTLDLTIRRISSAGFVPVSRVIIHRRSSASAYTMAQKGPCLEPEGPISFCLYSPYPNPFTNKATIRFSVPYAMPVSLKVYDVSGRLVNEMISDEVDPGIHTLQWTGVDDQNRKCGSGVYFVRFMAGDYVASKKMVMIK